ncbi:MAG TPA: Na+/H+ antiporter NhaA [Tepidiformaceae bacterium]|nr:Na+/H+ antiporter NhaA [Tepidiformaceae bacterium]
MSGAPAPGEEPNGTLRSFVARALIQPVQAFVATEASGGVVLLVATIAALVWANSPWGSQYTELWARHFSFEFARIALRMDLEQFVNDALMAVFFFVVGLEIKRELLSGELASPRKAMLPVAAAFGGMLVPALIFTAWNFGGRGAHGWGIPMATDIAFALGVLALLGRRATFPLKVFLLALAIVDDLGAILVIAVFYTDHIVLAAAGWAIVLAAAIVVLLLMGFRSKPVYLILALLFWLAVYKSGIHATIAGVVLAALTPAGARRPRGDQGEPVEEVDSSLDRLERLLHPWVSYLIVPVFALANAGLVLSSELVRDASTSHITLGIAMGLVVGKPVGVVLFSWLALRFGGARLPDGMTTYQLIGGGLLAGIGFTVSLFVTGLAFSDVQLTNDAKAGIFAASLIAGVLGCAWILMAPRMPRQPEGE